MPVSVSLIELVSVPGTAGLWPPEFKGFVEKCEQNTAERTHFGACADWLDEPEQGEHLLARGFRWLAKRPAVEVAKENSKNPNWFLAGLPRPFQYLDVPQRVDGSTLPGAVARLAYTLKRAAEDLE